MVIGDLGPEPGGGYRLAIAAGFDWIPRAFLDSDGNSQDMTEIVVDDDGRPLHLTYHRWSIPSIVGENDFVEGVVNARFSLINGPISIPSIDGPAPTASPSVEATDPLIRMTLPGVALTALIPAGATTEPRELTYYSPDGRASGIDLTYLVGSSDGLRFEVGVGDVPEDVFGASTSRDRIKGIRHAVPSRTPNGDMIGYRYLDVAGRPGQEVVATGQYEGQWMGLFRIRTVLIDRRLVVLVVSGSTDRVGSADADRFLRSLTAL